MMMMMIIIIIIIITVMGIYFYNITTMYNMLETKLRHSSNRVLLLSS
jgi:hypothetical protein